MAGRRVTLLEAATILHRMDTEHVVTAITPSGRPRRAGSKAYTGPDTSRHYSTDAAAMILAPEAADGEEVPSIAFKREPVELTQPTPAFGRRTAVPAAAAAPSTSAPSGAPPLRVPPPIAGIVAGVVVGRGGRQRQDLKEELVENLIDLASTCTRVSRSRYPSVEDGAQEPSRETTQA